MPFFRLYVIANELADVVPYDTHLLYPVSAYSLLLRIEVSPSKERIEAEYFVGIIPRWFNFCDFPPKILNDQGDNGIHTARMIFRAGYLA